MGCRSPPRTAPSRAVAWCPCGRDRPDGQARRKFQAPTAPKRQQPKANNHKPNSRNPTARAKPTAQGLKNQEGNLGGGDSRGERRCWCRRWPGCRRSGWRRGSCAVRRTTSHRAAASIPSGPCPGPPGPDPHPPKPHLHWASPHPSGRGATGRHTTGALHKLRAWSAL
jgi:hypothetical protein